MAGLQDSYIRYANYAIERRLIDTTSSYSLKSVDEMVIDENGDATGESECIKPSESKPLDAELVSSRSL